MACAMGAIIYDGRRTKIFLINEAVSSAAANQIPIVFLANGMTDFQGGVAPTEIKITKIGSVTEENISVAMIAVAATGCTFRKLTAGANADLTTWKVTLRIPRGIMG